MPIAIANWQLRPGDAHCDREVAVGAPGCPLGSRAGKEEDEEEEEEEDQPLIKSDDPHLAGAEKNV